MRLSCLSTPPLVLVLAQAACGADDPSFADGGSLGSGLAGSCLMFDGSTTTCAEFHHPAQDPTMYRDACESEGMGIWSNAACDTAGTVGGCRIAGGEASVTTWFFPPSTTATLMQVCTAPATYVPPR